VQAQTPTPVPFIVPPGGIAIIGYNFDGDDEFSFVCLTKIPGGTIVRFTDQGWTLNNSFLTFDFDGSFSWTVPSSGCEIGQIFTLLVNNFFTNMSLSSNGDQIIVHQHPSDQPINLIFALNAAGLNWMTDATNENNSSIPSVLSALTPSPVVSITTFDNAIYNGTKSFSTTTDALAAIVNVNNWTGHNTTRQTMPTGSFSFTTTAVEVNEFKADTNGVSTPWFVIVGLVVIPTLVMLWKKPKRNCCQ
jgi:hypothetical protein